MYGIFKKMFDGDVFNTSQISKLAAATMDTSLAGVGRVREGMGSIRRTRVVLGIEDQSKPAGTVKNYPTMAVNAGSSIGYVGQGLFTFPQGVIEIFGVCPNLTLTTTPSWAPTTPVMSIGTVTAGNDATLTGTEANVVSSTALTISAGAATFNPTDIAGTVLATDIATQVLTIPVPSLSALANAQVLNILPGFAGKITSVNFHVGASPATTAAKLATLTGQIAATPTTGGVVSLTSAAATPAGALISGTAVTGANTFTASQAIGVTVSAVTAFVEGGGVIEITVVNTDLQSALQQQLPRLVIDGTVTAAELFLNFACNSAVTSDTIIPAGTIDVIWAALSLTSPP